MDGKENNRSMISKWLSDLVMNPGGGPNKKELAKAVSGKVVLVTGASYGIGEATARMLGDAGATVLLVARSKEPLEANAKRIVEGGGKAFAYPTDLTDFDAVEELATTILKEHDHVDVLVNNAGKSIRRSMELSWDRFQDFKRTVDINYLGLVRLLTTLLPRMRERKQGHIINVATFGSRLPAMPRWGAYQASKGAFDVLLRSIDHEMRHEGIVTTSVYMALVHTRMSAPNPLFRAMPGMTPNEAAALVGRAIVERKRDIAPWWLYPSEVGGTILRNSTDWLMRLAHQVTTDTRSAQRSAGRAPIPSNRIGELAQTGQLLGGVVSGIDKVGLLDGLSAADLPEVMRAVGRYGPSIALLTALCAIRSPERIAFVDDEGSVTWAEADRMISNIGAKLQQQYSLAPTNTIGLLGRNHRQMAMAILAATCTGAELLLLNTEFPAPQLKQVLARHDMGLLFCDPEFLPLLEQAGYDGRLVVNLPEPTTTHTTLDDLARDGDMTLRPAPGRSKITLLTSGTTGVPRGAPRDQSVTGFLGAAATLLHGIPFESGMTILLCPPLFHGFGLGYLTVTLLLGGTAILRRRFDAQTTLQDIDRHQAHLIAAVPVMYQRMLALDKNIRKEQELSSLRAMITGGAPLPPSLCRDTLEYFGPYLYNLYGSSETGFLTMATPDDLASAPGSVGRPVEGVSIRLLDHQGRQVQPGETGRIFVRSGSEFTGYSGGGSKDVINGHMSTGDMGRFDNRGRLFIEGREDDMIISGGENVYPQEVEEILLDHPNVNDVAVIGVPDDEFGQRLKAFVVGKDDEDALRAHIKKNLARYKMPRDFAFVEELPRNASGKMVKKALK